MKSKQTLTKVRNDYARLFNVNGHEDIEINVRCFLI